jgi:hypothetical protein
MVQINAVETDDSIGKEFQSRKPGKEVCYTA